LKLAKGPEILFYSRKSGMTIIVNLNTKIQKIKSYTSSSTHACY